MNCLRVFDGGHVCLCVIVRRRGKVLVCRGHRTWKQRQEANRPFTHKYLYLNTYLHHKVCLCICVVVHRHIRTHIKWEYAGKRYKGNKRFGRGESYAWFWRMHTIVGRHMIQHCHVWNESKRDGYVVTLLVKLDRPRFGWMPKNPWHGAIWKAGTIKRAFGCLSSSWHNKWTPRLYKLLNAYYNWFSSLHQFQGHKNERKWKMRVGMTINKN